MKLVFSSWNSEKIIKVSTMKEAIPVIIEEAEYDENGNKNEDWKILKWFRTSQDRWTVREKISSYFCIMEVEMFILYKNNIINHRKKEIYNEFF